MNEWSWHGRCPDPGLLLPLWHLLREGPCPCLLVVGTLCPSFPGPDLLCLSQSWGCGRSLVQSSPSVQGRSILVTKSL